MKVQDVKDFCDQRGLRSAVVVSRDKRGRTWVTSYGATQFEKHNMIDFADTIRERMGISNDDLTEDFRDPAKKPVLQDRHPETAYNERRRVAE